MEPIANSRHETESLDRLLDVLKLIVSCDHRVTGANLVSLLTSIGDRFDNLESQWEGTLLQLLKAIREDLLGVVEER